MIRSDYICKRTVTLEYILYVCIFVLRVGFGTTHHCNERCQPSITIPNAHDYRYVTDIDRSGYIQFKVNAHHSHLQDPIVYIGLYSDNVTDIEYEIIVYTDKCEIRNFRKRDQPDILYLGTCNITLCRGTFWMFWLNYDYGMFKLGQLSDQGSEIFIEYNNTNPHLDIHSVVIKTMSSTLVKLCVFDTDNGTQTAQTEETSSTVDNTVTTDTNAPIVMNTTPSSSDDGTRSAEQTSSTVDSTVTSATPPPTPHIPMIMSMTPSYGPVSGGTEVTITGSFLDSITKLWLGSNLMYELDFMMESGNISAVTPEYSGPEPNETGVLLNVMYNVMTVTRIQFKYKRDPHVVDIYPRKMTKSGGLTVTVEGSSLDSVAAPMLTVTVIQRSDQNQRTTYPSPCKAESSKQLLCVTPKINTKRKRHTADNRHRRESNDEELDFVLGLQFDGADNYEDLTNNLPHLAHIEVHQDPSFNPGQMFAFDPEFAGAIGIKGENIDAGVVVADYNVSIGKGFCTNIGITSDKLYCNPPLTLDEVTGGNSINTTRAHNEVDITVRVGTNLVYTVGYIVYDIEETISLYTIFVPVVAALGALLVVFVIILIVCCCRKARAKKDSDKTLAPSAQDLNTLEPSRNDNYYTDETQPKNQYYMVVNQGANGQ